MLDDIKNPQLKKVNEMSNLEISEALVTGKWPEGITTHQAVAFGERILMLRQFQDNLKATKNLIKATWGLGIVTSLLVLVTIVIGVYF